VKKRFTEEQIIGFLKEADKSLPVRSFAASTGSRADSVFDRIASDSLTAQSLSAPIFQYPATLWCLVARRASRLASKHRWRPL
jgi:hypothetical protein